MTGALAPVLFGLLLASAPEASVPSVALVYNPAFDEACAERIGEPLEPATVDELERRLPTLQSAWLELGPPWLEAARDSVGRPFGFAEATASLVTCGAPSWSRPLTINTRPYLRKSAGRRPADVRQFVRTVLHEVLHRYVANALAAGGTSELLRKYAHEPEVVRQHLHLFAIEEAVYLPQDLAGVQAFEATLMDARRFARARQIVRTEGKDAFLSELKAGD
jgi:hypothetical protein